jgi:hypothetical protein
MHDQTAINTFVLLLKQSDVFTIEIDGIASAFSKIAVNDRIAIDELNLLLQQDTLDFSRKIIIASALAQINGDDRIAVDKPVWLLEDEEYLPEVIGEDDKYVIETFPSEIWQLKNNVTHEVYNSNFKLYDSCYKILFHCAKTLTYQKFHAAWHQTLPTQTNPISPDLANRSHTIHLNITDLNTYTTPDDITTELSIRIYQQLTITPIPDTPTIPQLKRQLINRQLHPHLVLILEHPNPTATLITTISNLHTSNQIQLIWLTNAPIPHALRPEQ